MGTAGQTDSTLPDSSQMSERYASAICTLLRYDIQHLSAVPHTASVPRSRSTQPDGNRHRSIAQPKRRVLADSERPVV